MLTPREAADYLGLHVETVRRLARERKMPAMKVGKGWRFMKESLTRWAEDNGHDSGAEHVLVVDDDMDVLIFMERLLKKAGYRVSTASSGEEALDIVEADLPDLAIIDLKMPGMGGPALLGKAHKLRPGLPVIIHTGYPDSELMAEALESAPFTILTKPSPGEKIIEAVRAAIYINRQKSVEKSA